MASSETDNVTDAMETVSIEDETETDTSGPAVVTMETGVSGSGDGSPGNDTMDTTDTEVTGTAKVTPTYVVISTTEIIATPEAMTSKTTTPSTTAPTTIKETTTGTVSSNTTATPSTTSVKTPATVKTVTAARPEVMSTEPTSTTTSAISATTTATSATSAAVNQPHTSLRYPDPTLKQADMADTSSKRESTMKKMKRFMTSIGKPGKKKSKPEESDSDSEEEMMMKMMYGYDRRIPPRIMRELEHQGLPPRMIQELVHHGHPAMIMELLRHSRREGGSKPFGPNRSKSGKWEDPLGLGYEKEKIEEEKKSEEKEWTSPEPVIPTQRQPDKWDQVKNSAGGYVWDVDDMVRVRRLFCLGTESGSFYKNSLELTMENTQAVKRLLEAKRGEDLVKEIIEFSNGRAAKLNSMLFVLAMCARQSEHLTTKRAAYKALSQVCRIPTHLFIFMEYYSNLGKRADSDSTKGWGRAHRFGIANWYHSFKDNPFKLALHVTKYRQRNGWSHRDVIRLSHPKPSSERGSPGLACVLKYVVKGYEPAKKTFLTDDTDYGIKKILNFLEATEEAKLLKPADEDKACELIKRHRLVREHLPTELLNSVSVWRALLQNMPMTALIRNLGKMTKIGLISQGSEESKLAMEKLTNPDQLKGARIHPFNVLLARHQYSLGKGDKGHLEWNPNPEIVDALEKAFYLSFKSVEPTNKRFCIALDISGSMDYNCTNGTPLKSREAAAAMAMVTVRTEKRHSVIGFHHEMIPLQITPEMNLTEVIEETKKYGFGGTDCAKPMTWAMDNKMLYDTFIVYTDCETHSGQFHPSNAIKNYRRESGIVDARLIVVAMTSNGFTIADPEDAFMLDVVGFDSAAPEIISNFVLGKI